jgi:hypothetical protein
MAIPTVAATQIHDQATNVTTTGAITLSLGTISEDDVIIILTALDGTPGVVSVSGNQSGSATVIRRNDETNVQATAHRLIVGATPDTTITTSWTTSQQGRIMFVRLTGVDVTGDPIDAVGANNNGTGTTATPTSPASTVVDTLFIGMVAVDRNRVDAADTVTGTGWSETGTSGSSGGANGAGLIVGELDQASIGTPANPVFGTWTSDEFASFVFNVIGAEITGFPHSQGYVIG